MISIKLQSSIIEITLGHSCSPVNLLHIFRTPFLKNTSRRLLLKISDDFHLSIYDPFVKNAIFTFDSDKPIDIKCCGKQKKLLWLLTDRFELKNFFLHCLHERLSCLRKFSSDKRAFEGFISEIFHQIENFQLCFLKSKNTHTQNNQRTDSNLLEILLTLRYACHSR